MSLEDPPQVAADYRGLFYACEEDHYEDVKRLLEHYNGDINSIRNDLNQTPLHVAASKGNIKIVVLLMDKNANSVEKDKIMRTPLMYACHEGHTEVVQLLLSKIPKGDPSLDIQDKYKSTAIHLAAMKGHEEIVQALIDHEVDCKKQDKYKRTPMMCACINGHVEVIKHLLQIGYERSPVTYYQEEKVTNKSNEGTDNNGVQETDFHAGTARKETPGNDTVSLLSPLGNGDRETMKKGKFVSVLMKAISRKREDVAIAILESRQAREALEYSFEDKDGNKVDALRKMIEKMPYATERAFRFCVDEPAPGDYIDIDEEEITFHYEFIDDLAFECLETNASQKKPQSGYKASNHCLNILLESDNSLELIKHPLITTLLYKKWTSFAQALLAANFILHVLNVLFLTIFATVVYQPRSEICIASNVTRCGETSRQYTAGVFATLVLLLSIIKLGLEFFQMIVLWRRYFCDWINYVDLFMAGGSFLFAFIYTFDCFCPESWQWQLGALCVFLAWINFIHFIRMLPLFGIYVIMFGVIVKKFLHVVILAILLILSFTIPFYMLLHDPIADKNLHTPFQDPGKSFMKTLTMTTGELEYTTLFRQTYSSGPGLQYGISYLLWILFVVLMPTLLNNLLTGLAVDDVNQIRENAKIQTLCLWARHLQTVEQLLPFYLYRKHRKQMSLEGKEYTIDLLNFPARPTSKYCNVFGDLYCRYKKWVWFKSIELDHFDTYDNTVLPEQDSKKTDKLLKQMSKLTSEIETMKKRLFEANEEIFRISNKLPAKRSDDE